ncbi:uncharacterized protein LOC141578987 isoform X2 [Camelus bactrianus]
MSCDPVDAQHISEPTGVREEMGTSHYCGGCTLSDALRFGEGFTTAEARCQPPAEETDCLRYMKGEDTYYPHGAQVGLGVCCLYSRWARVALGIPVPEFLQYSRCLFPNLQNWNDVNHPAVHSMVHPRLELIGSMSISEGTYLKRNGFPDSEGQRKHQPGLEKENSISEPVLGDLTEITLVAQASDREHVPSCSQPQTSTDASYTGKDPGLGGRWPPEIRQMLDSSLTTGSGQDVLRGRRQPPRQRRRGLSLASRSICSHLNICCPSFAGRPSPVYPSPGR